MAVPDLRALVERHFRVYETREEKRGGEVALRVFCVMYPAGEFDARFSALRTELRAMDPELVAFLRHVGGEDLLHIGRRPPPPPRDTALAVTLLLLTLLTTLMAGIQFWHGYAHSNAPWKTSDLWDKEHLLMGFLMFSLPIMSVLGFHELAHYVAARRHGLRPTLPRFIPWPPIVFPLGTLGAFISIRDEMPDRKALFDVGASGPLAGFLLAIPLLFVGAHLTMVNQVPVPDIGHPALEADRAFTDLRLETGHERMVFNDTHEGTFSFQVRAPVDDDDPWNYQMLSSLTDAGGNVTTDLVEGSLGKGNATLRTFTVPAGTKNATLDITWDDHLQKFGDPAFISGVRTPEFDSGGRHVGSVVLIPSIIQTFWPNLDKFLVHPLFFAGWVGLLVTGINLLPIGQLDGGHVARAMLGERMRYAAYAATGLLFILAFFFNSWFVMAILVMWMGVRHPPPLNERTPLGRGRIALGLLVLLVFAFTFVPVPILP